MQQLSGKDSEIPWVEKYRPRSLKEIQDMEEIKEQLVKFLDGYFKFQKEIKRITQMLNKESDKQKKKKLSMKLKSLNTKMLSYKARLLMGPPGVGKTTIVYALANDYNLSVIELNASDTRTKTALEEKLQETVLSTNLLSFTQSSKKGKLILIDEVDGLHGQQDRGGVSALKEIIRTSKYPIIMTCNFRDDQKFGELYKLAKPIIQVPPAKPQAIAATLEKIAKMEGIEISPEQIQKIVKRTGGDFRSAINDLQGLAQGGNGIDDDALENINMNRDKDEEIYKALFDMLKAESIQEAKNTMDLISQREADFRIIHRWINENLFKFYTRTADIYFASGILAFVDRILGYLLRIQDYSHLSYFYDILAGGIRYSKSDGLIKYQKLNFPRWFRTKASPDDEILKTIQKYYRISQDEAMKDIKEKLKLMLKLDDKLIFELAALFKMDIKEKEKTKDALLKILSA